EGGQGDAPPSAADPGADATEGDGPPDAEAALPDVERVQRTATVAEVRVRRGEDVVEPAADDPERHHPGGDFRDVAGAPAARHPTALAEPDGHHDPGDDAHRVGAQRHRPEVPDALGRAGERVRDHDALTL